MTSSLQRAILFLLVFGALGVRLVFLGYTPFYHAESQYAEAALYVLPCLREGSLPQALWRQWHIFTLGGNPFYWLYPVNIPIAWFFGVNEVTIRLPAAIAGFISCILVYILVRRHSDKKTALIALALVAFNPFLIAFNRTGFPDSVQAMLLLFGMLFLDIYCQKRHKAWLFLCAFCFALAYLIKPNAIFFIVLTTFLYHLYGGLRRLDVVAIGAVAIVGALLLFVDQLPIFIRSALLLGGHAGVFAKTDFYLLNIYLALRGYLLYADHILVPAVLCLSFLRREKEPLFRILFFASIIYFAIVVFQGRFFFRYMQIGLLTLLSALAYAISQFDQKQYRFGAVTFLVLYIAWGFVAHASYIGTQYHHIPYRYMREKVLELRGSGRILGERSNTEVAYYLSPSHIGQFSTAVDPCRTVWVELGRGDEYIEVPLSSDVLLDPDVARSGDILVVSGEQMAGGEPNPQSLGIKSPMTLEIKGLKIPLIGLRKYGHTLNGVKEFYEEYLRDTRLREAYVLVENIFLTNGSDELAALVLRKI